MDNLGDWQTVTLQSVAEGIVEVSKGNLKLFGINISNEATSWGRLCDHLGLSNIKLNRHWIRTIYYFNSKSLKDLSKEICLQQKLKLTPYSFRRTGKKYCYCQFPEPRNTSIDMMICSKCSQWFHNLCVGEEESQDDLNKSQNSWICPTCNGHDVRKLIPRIILNHSEQRDYNMAESELDGLNLDAAQDRCASNDLQFQGEDKLASTASNKIVPSAVVETVYENPTGMDQLIGSEFGNDMLSSSIVSSNDALPVPDFSLGDQIMQQSMPPSQSEPRYGPKHVRFEVPLLVAADETEALPDSNETEPEIVTLKISESCQMEISAADWDIIKPQPNPNPVKNKRYQFQLKRNAWTPVFTASFMKHATQRNQQLKGCLLKFHDHRINMDSGLFLSTTAKCIRPGIKCEVKLAFSITSQPKPGTNVIVNVKIDGELRHDKGSGGKRRLTGEDRKALKERLTTTTASKLHHGLYSEPATDKIQLHEGNDTQVQSVDVLRKARSEALSEQDLDKDGFLDLIKRKARFQESTKYQGDVSGLIQELSFCPFYVVLYSEQQFKILNRLLKLDPYHCLYMDSTGTISTGLGKEYTTKRQFYYALTTLFPGPSDVAVIPLLEFISADHSTVTLSNILHYFFSRFGTFSGHRNSGFSIKRITTDFSKALISATLQGLEIGTTIQYVTTAWDCLANQEPIGYVHHVCFWHVRKAIFGHVDVLFKGREETKNLVKLWVTELLNCSDLWDYSRRVDEILIICGLQQTDEQLPSIIENLKSSTDESGNPKFSISDTKVHQARLPFYAQSPFGLFALKKCHKMQLQIPTSFYRNAKLPEEFPTAASLTVCSIENPHHSLKFIEYLLEHIFPYQCLLDNSLISLMNMSSTGLTNGTAESWNAILKERELKWKLPDRVGRVIEKIQMCTEGRIDKFQYHLGRYEIQRHGSTRCSAQISISGPAQPNQKEPSNQLNSNDDHLLPDRATEMWSSKQRSKQKLPVEQSQVGRVTLFPANEHIIINGEKIYLQNSSWIDAVLQALHAVTTLNSASNSYLRICSENGFKNSEELTEILNHVNCSRISDALTTFLKQFLKYDLTDKPSEEFILINKSPEAFFNQIKWLYSIKEEYICPVESCSITKTSLSQPICVFSKQIFRNDQTVTTKLKSERILPACQGRHECLTETEPVVRLSWGILGAPPFFCIPILNGNETVKEKNLPEYLDILNVKFQLFVYTVCEEGFYYNVMISKGKRKLLTRGYPLHKGMEGDHYISCVWYLRKN